MKSQELSGSSHVLKIVAAADQINRDLIAQSRLRRQQPIQARPWRFDQHDPENLSQAGELAARIVELNAGYDDRTVLLHAYERELVDALAYRLLATLQQLGCFCQAVGPACLTQQYKSVAPASLQRFFYRIRHID